MDTRQLLEKARELESKKKGKKDELERLQKLFERFQLLNRKFLDKETFEKAHGSAASMVEAIDATLRFLDEEIARLRNKRMKLPFETIDLNEMQKVQARNELLLKDYLAAFKE